MVWASLQGTKTWYSFLPQREMIPVAFFLSRTRTCSCPNPVVWFIACPDCALSLAGREDQAKSTLLWRRMVIQRQQAQGQGVQPFHSANVLINHDCKIQAVMGTTECDRIREGRGGKAASQRVSLLQGFHSSSGWPSSFLVILGEFEVIHTLIFLFHLPVSFFLFLTTVSRKMCSGHPLSSRDGTGRSTVFCGAFLSFP